MNTPINWNDPTYIWNGIENYNWDNAYRTVQEFITVSGWEEQPLSWEKTRHKIPNDLAEKFLDVVIQVNGLSKNYKKTIAEKPIITIEHIQKTISKYKYSNVKVKVDKIK